MPGRGLLASVIRIAGEWRRTVCLEIRIGGGLFIRRTGQRPIELVGRAMRLGRLRRERIGAVRIGAAGLTDSKRSIKRIGEWRTAVPTDRAYLARRGGGGRRLGVVDKRLRGDRRSNGWNGGNPECLRIRG